MTSKEGQKTYCPNCGSIVEDNICPECREKIIQENKPVIGTSEKKLGVSMRIEKWAGGLSICQKIVLGLWSLFWGYVFYQTYLGYWKIIIGGA